MKKTQVIWIALLLIAALFMGCPEESSTPTPPPATDTRVALTAGSAVTVVAESTSADAHFHGATGLLLSKNDFTVTTGGTITNVTNTGGVATVVVSFAANTSSTAQKTFTVGIATTSKLIKGNATVLITQLKVGETVDPAVIIGTGADAEPTQSSATVKFTGSEITGKNLTAADFTVTTGGSISTVSVAGNVVSVTVTFSPNTTSTEKEYTVSFSSSSSVSTDATATIRHYSPNDTRAILTTTETSVVVNWVATSAKANFNGATGLTLAAADFAVTTGGTISNVTVNGGTAEVTVTFAQNITEEPEEYVVSVATSSTKIRGAATVTIVQKEKEPIVLTAGAPVTVDHTATSAIATFSGAYGLTLAAADFEVTTGGSITEVTVAGDIASVTVNFAANTSMMVTKIYTVSIASSSELITGSATVHINQLKQPMPPLTLNPATNYLIQNYEGINTTLSWTKIFGTEGNTGDVPEALVADPAGGNGKVGSYSITGSGNRAVALNFAPQDTIDVVKGDVILAEFDWYPNTYPSTDYTGPLYITLYDARSTNATTHGKKIISFVNEHNSTLKYRLGDFGETDNPLGEAAVEIPDTLEKTKWYKFQVVIDFTENKISRLYVWDKATNDEIYAAMDLPLDLSTYSHEVRTMRLYGIRVGGTHTFYLDNIFVGNGARTSDDRTLLTAGANVNVKGAVTTATATFTGVTGVPPTGLTLSDFTVTAGGTVSGVSVTDNTASVTVTFVANDSDSVDNTYIVGISPSSAAIRGITTVLITQKNIGKVELGSGTAVNVNCFATTGVVSFAGAGALTTEDLVIADFTVDNGGTISAVAVTNPGASNAAVSVTVTFARNNTGSAVVYTVGIAGTSETVKGSATATITQALFGKLSLTAGTAVSVANSATTGTATFNGAVNLTNSDLTIADFTISAGGSLASVSVTGTGVVSVTATFPAGTGAPVTYTVGIDASSAFITGSVTVGITQTVASFLETFEIDTASLVWSATAVGLNGQCDQAIADGVATYTMNGTGGRGGGFNFKPQNVIISDDKVYVNFDWMPLKSAMWQGNGPARISINANDGTLNGGRIISFLVNKSDTSFYYRLDNDTAIIGNGALGADAVKISDSQTNSGLIAWFNISIIIDFGLDKVSFTITSKDDALKTWTLVDLPLNATVKDLNRVGAIRLENGRPDASGWQTCLDNFYVGNTPKP